MKRGSANECFMGVGWSGEPLGRNPKLWRQQLGKRPHPDVP